MNDAPGMEGAATEGRVPTRDGSPRDHAALWEDDCREFVLGCDASGVIVSLDARSRKKLGVGPGVPFFALAAPGSEEKARTIFERGRREPVRDSELALVMAERVVTVSFRAKPDGGGGVSLLGCALPLDYGGALEQVQASMAEVLDLNRRVSRQKITTW